jgi:hypothetical protein
MGYRGTFPEREIRNLQVKKYDVLAAREYRQTFAAAPPEDLFRYFRPATDDEWVRD